jgi:alginate O-acetyltransferase complex protein AlgI
MLFNSPEFIIFFLLVYCCYLAIPFRFQNYMLLLASYVFYGWWDTRFLFLVAISTTIDFWVGLMLQNGRLNRMQQLMPGLYLLVSGIVFLGVNLNVLWGRGFANYASADLLRKPMVWWASVGTLAFLAFMFVLYHFVLKLKGHRQRQVCLSVSLVTQLGLLGFFKYFNFFADGLAAALNDIGIQSSALHLNIILPVGVSFYTFQSLSYTIDIYRGQFKPTDKFLDFALFVAYFPQLQAGPIERARHLLPQLANPRQVTLDRISSGLYLIVLGFFKKVAIADGVAPVVDQIFGTSGRVTWIDVVTGAVLFAVQIYCDFSGYTDIARGTSKLLGIDLIINFNQPYFASNAQDFWRRWHISLSSWLRDYLYIPLGGNHGNLAFVCRNLMITMLLGGLWHGASWNFVLWGFYQGSLLCIYRVWREHQVQGQSDRNPKKLIALEKWWLPTRVGHSGIHLAATAIFFAFVCYGWLLFRSHSLKQIGEFTSLLVTDFGNLDYGAGMPRLSSLAGLPLLFMIEISQFWTDDHQALRRFPVPLQSLVLSIMLAIIMIGMSNEPAQFIYFQF